MLALVVALAQRQERDPPVALQLLLEVIIGVGFVADKSAAGGKSDLHLVEPRQVVTTAAQQHDFDRPAGSRNDRMSAQTIEVFFLGRTVPPIGSCFVLVEPTALGALVMANREGT